MVSSEEVSSPQDLLEQVSSKNYQKKPHKQFGCFLTEDSGKEYAQTRNYGTRMFIWIVLWVLCVAGTVYLYVAITLPAVEMINDAIAWGANTSEMGWYLFLTWVTLFSLIVIDIAYLVYLFLVDSIVKKTRVSVFESGITGVGAGKRLGSWSFVYSDTSRFQLGYNKIASVDVKKENFLAINAYGKVYVIAAANPDEVARIINDKIYIR